MKNLEQEKESLKEITNQYKYDTYNYDYSSYETNLRRFIRIRDLRFHCLQPIHCKRIRT